MRRALTLAARGRGRTSPNPMVGAVIVKNGRVIGEGYHQKAGLAHAEVVAISRAIKTGEAIKTDNTKGATLYVTLEPCSTQGRTPPCTDAIRRAGIKRVVIGAMDPNPKHAGRAVNLLEQDGVIVKTGVLEKEARALNRVFNHWITTRSAWVIAKAAMTLDGKIATKTGDSKWITNPRSRRLTRQWRAEVDAILVGINTITRDNPRLTAQGFKRNRPLLRIVLDPHGKIPLRSKVLKVSKSYPTLLVTSLKTQRAKDEKLKQAGAILWKLPLKKEGFPLRRLLEKLGQNEITSVLVEGGSETLGAFFDQKLVNQAAFFYAPKLIGGSRAVKAVGGKGIKKMEEAPIFHDLELRRLGEDLLIIGFPAYFTKKDTVYV